MHGAVKPTTISSAGAIVLSIDVSPASQWLFCQAGEYYALETQEEMDGAVNRR
jgi:hypothetical protein